MNCLIKGIALLGVVALTGCSTGFSKSSNAALRRMAVEEPESPAGIVPVPDMKTTGAGGAVYVPPGAGLVGAAIVGVAAGLAEQSLKEKPAAENIPPPNGLTFLADSHVKVGAILADDMRSALTAEGYTVVPAATDADSSGVDAVVSFKIIELGYQFGFDGLWHPNLQLWVTLKNAHTKATLFKQIYHYTGFVHNMWAEQIDADPQYAATTADMFADNDKLLLESLRAGAGKSVARAAAALRPS
jgi:hypothetical protein